MVLADSAAMSLDLCGYSFEYQHDNFNGWTIKSDILEAIGQELSMFQAIQV